eukprot:TRINITY_DN6985_c0_g1_i2.p1 TRINITY_DN6985_c0_g1~~TRINITY_DN6985_c0_g1_i2.p1  ORF type:complete len:745 (+),score=126.72 TRINITY_DN6985_c0_g1_i2:114-2348(+)
METLSLKDKPILPIPGKRNILITSALPYVNNVPHLGNIVGCVLSADVFARFCRLRGENVIYVCGTDEYGTATETKAQQEGLTPQQICDKYYKIHKEVYDWFGIAFDKFGRTSTQEQTKIAQDIFTHLYEAGFTEEQIVEQLYCDACQRFLADRFVNGICPICKFDDARGDQCDKCGNLINPVELVEPRCSTCKKTPNVRTSEHLFIDLPKISDRLGQWVDEASEKGQWSSNALQVTKAWLKEGLKPRCITRDLRWGTPVPLEKYKNKVFYVWFDAPIGYISITATYTPDWEKWWKKDADTNVQLYQFMGKDNVPFHTVVFPASLLATGEPWTFLHHISTTEYLNYEDGKFSKSRGTGVFGTDCKDTGIPPEVWRYYLLINRPESADSVFSWEDLREKNNNELIANLGNFINRPFSFLTKEFGGVVPPYCGELHPDDQILFDEINKLLAQYIAALSAVHIKEGLKYAMAISQKGNAYLQHRKPWELVKTDRDRCSSVIHVVVNLAKLVAAVFEPFMPSFSEKVLRQLNLSAASIPDAFVLDVPAGHKVGTAEPIFRIISDKEIEVWRTKYGGKKANTQQSEVFPLDVRGGVVAEVFDHPSDPNLFVTEVNVGAEKRQVVARLKEVYSREQLLGRKVVVLCNLPPADIRGAKSEGMLLVAETKTLTRLLQPENYNIPADQWSGVRILADGTTPVPKADLTLKEFQKLDVKLHGGKAAYKTKHVWKTDSADALRIQADGVDATAKVK